ncbi:MAG: hypothetical protein ACYCOO_04015 [Chitinophagaceae bacterium]
MKCFFLIVVFGMVFSFPSIGQDTTGNFLARTIHLDEVVIKASRVGFNVENFIRLVEEDTTFYKAFKNLRILGYTAHNDIRIFNKRGKVKASLNSLTRQIEKKGCRTMQVLQQKITGDFFNRQGQYNYYTAELYSRLFFTKGEVCGEDNIVQGGAPDGNEDSGSLQRHKDQLKTLIFNPGKSVPGVPMVGDEMARMYDFSISSRDFQGVPCFVFTAKVKPFPIQHVVINELQTYFNKSNFDIVARNYNLSYHTLLFDFNVQMQVQMTNFGHLLVPAKIHYQGNWDVLFRKRERAVFTMQLSDFNY